MSLVDACAGARATATRAAFTNASMPGVNGGSATVNDAFTPIRGRGVARTVFFAPKRHHNRIRTNPNAAAISGYNSEPWSEYDAKHASRSRWPQERNHNLAAKNLRALLAAPGIIQTPCAHDALSAALIERAGFNAGFMSGFCVSAARLAMPDAGLISYGEMEDVGRHICEAVSPGFPFIGDADDGYGNAMNAKRTVRGYARAGFAGILMEDQVAPKACGHTRNRRVIPRSDAVARIKAACDERDEGGGGGRCDFCQE